jgi:hypothetical protein
VLLFENVESPLCAMNLASQLALKVDGAITMTVSPGGANHAQSDVRPHQMQPWLGRKHTDIVFIMSQQV